MRTRTWICTIACVGTIGALGAVYLSTSSSSRIVEPAIVRSEDGTHVPTVSSLALGAIQIAKYNLAESQRPKPAPVFDPDARAKAIWNSATFQTFAKKVHWNEDKGLEITRILSLYQNNVAGIEAVASDDETAASMLSQLRGDTFAQIHSRIPEADWDAFRATRLLDDIAPKMSENVELAHQ